MYAKPFSALLLATSLLLPAVAHTATYTLEQAVAAPWRASEHKARDNDRHPLETLRFFDIQPDQRVIEITPGNGWYSEILAPLLKDRGHYTAAIYSTEGLSPSYIKAGEALQAKFAANPTLYGKVDVISFDKKQPVFGPPASADRVLSFRNAHNWVAEGNAAATFKAFFDVLKPGGILGLVDHRAAEGTPLPEALEKGYLPTQAIIQLATDAGFETDGQSEVNANPKDTKQYPGGVWSLPPTYRDGQHNREQYQRIGESDRFTLRLRKPEH